MRLRLARSLGRDARGLPRLAAGCSLVHANTSVILGAGLARLPTVVHVREIYDGWGPLWPAYRRVLRRADALIAVSEATRAPLGAGRVIHDGLAAAPVRMERAAARAALGLAPDAFVVAVLGRISGWKGQTLLARALARLPPDTVGLIAGDAWPGQEHHERELRAAADAAGARLHMAGFVEDVGAVYGAADVVVVPSTRPDPFPNAALEAAAAGCCVVAAAHGGLPEIVRDGATGRLFPPGAEAALAAILAELRARPEERARLGAAAAADIAARFSAARMAERCRTSTTRSL